MRVASFVSQQSMMKGTINYEEENYDANINWNESVLESGSQCSQLLPSSLSISRD